MDILAHGQWVGLDSAAWHRRRPLDRRTVSLAFTHSPVFHPLTYRGFDGLAWQTHWFMRANDTAMACAALVLLTRRHR